MLRKLRKLLRLSLAEWALLLSALPTVVAIRLGLSVLPFRFVHTAVGRVVNSGSTWPTRRITPKQVAWAVRVASRYVPAATCLTQALATQVMLALLGLRSVLRIGVTHGDAGKFEAHAWLEHEDQIVIGGEGHRRFTPFPPIEAVQL